MTAIRIVSFVGVCAGALFLPFWYFLPLAIIYALCFHGYELLLLSVFIDAQFGDVEQRIWFLYTLTVAVILIVTTLLKPYLRFYSS